jgi:hypothetical protein
MTKDEQIKGMANPNRGSVGVQEARPAPVQLTPAAKRQWVGLTKADINEIWKGEPMLLPWDMTRTLAIEQRLKEKNT